MENCGTQMDCGLYKRVPSKYVIMSVQGWTAVCLKTQKKSVYDGLKFLRSFSRKSINSEGPFTVIKSRKPEKSDTNLAWRDPNIEILTAKCFPFFLPGNIGPAWYDKHTTVRNEGTFIMEALGEKQNENIICKIQTCPKVLRKTVTDLFPYRNLEQSELSVVTISIKPDLKLLRKNTEIETEKLTQAFVLIAKNVCNKLRKGGYWADFINPFSGRPYFSVTTGDELYSTDEKFRCLDFQIFEIEKCLIVSNEEDKTKRKFIGSLFTSAPSKKNHLNEMFTK